MWQEIQARPHQPFVGAPRSKESSCGYISSNTVHLPLGAPYRDLERVHRHLVLHGIQGGPAGPRGGIADWEALGWPAEGHFRGSNGRLVRVLVVAVDAERGQQDRDDEGEEDGSCDHRAAQLVTQRTCGRARQRVSAAWRGLCCGRGTALLAIPDHCSPSRGKPGARAHCPGRTAEAGCQPHQLYRLPVTSIWMAIAR